MAEKQDKPSSSQDVGEAEVQKNMDEETDKGYQGVVQDDTPNENYTVRGVVADKPTPENSAGKES